MNALLWIASHKTELGALWGAASLLALTVVKLTPTPADDNALAKVQPWLRAICLIFGLRANQGVTIQPSDPPPDLPDRPEVPRTDNPTWPPKMTG